MAEVKNPDLNAKHQHILRTMMKLPENKNCADCLAPYPRWASTNLGIFVCMACSGIHRKLGTHISQVRSVTLDTWTPAQVAHFQKLGNKKAAAYFESCLPDNYPRPHSSDTARMESFIRQKYEHRRFITVDNGGLGGAEVPSARASIGALPSQGASRGRAAAKRPTYDDGPRTNRATASSSYAARFSAGAPHGANSRQNTLGGTRPSAQSSVSTTAPDALQRAGTLKELVNMGFSTTIALRAVQASQGDLQRAVDWVLANSGGTGGEVATAPAKAPAPTPAPARNLLDFDDPPAASATPAAQTNGSAAANGATQQTGPAGAAKPAAGTSAPAKKAPAHFGDFGDFGDFASALPRSKPATASPQTKPVAAAAAAPATGLDALAELYKKGPTKAPSPGRPVTQPVRNPGLATQSPVTRPLSSGMQTAASKPISPLPGMMRPGSSRAASKPISPLPGMARPGVSPSKKPVSTAIGMPVIDIKRNPAAIVATAAKARSPQPPAAKSPPPPPPPMQEKAIVSDSALPPPSSPPPDANGKSTEESPPEAPAAENGAKPTVMEDEDPFAALSMMALSSSKSRKESKPKTMEPPVLEPTVTKAPAAQPVAPPKAKAVEAVPAPASGAINLDDFFG